MGQIDASQGQLLLGTDVSGRAAKMGHRLTIAMERWQATVTWAGQRPSAATLRVDVDSLRVLRGEGGLTPLTAAEKPVIRSNAFGCLDPDTYPQIRFESQDIATTDAGYRLTGTVQIHGQSRPHVVDLRVAPVDQQSRSWRIECATSVRHSDFGVRRYSMLMGAVRIADEVTVSFSATVTAEEIGMP